MRERLADFYSPGSKQTFCFTAIFHCFAKTDQGSNVALLRQIQHNGKFSCDHNWVHRSRELKQLAPEKGDLLAFEAVVGRYPRQGESFSRVEEVQWDFSLEHLKDIRILCKGKDNEDERSEQK